jgi:hypothetical protein
VKSYKVKQLRELDSIFAPTAINARNRNDVVVGAAIPAVCELSLYPEALFLAGDCLDLFHPAIKPALADLSIICCHKFGAKRATIVFWMRKEIFLSK